MRARFATIVAGGVIASLLMSGCASATPTPAKPTPTAAAPGSGPAQGQRIITEGRVKPVRSVELAFAAPGTVTEVLVREGLQVKKDQPLARIDSGRQATALANAQAALLQVKAGQLQVQAALASAQAALADVKPGGRTNEIASARAALQAAEAALAQVKAGADPFQLTAAKAAMDRAARAVQQAQFAYDNSSGPAQQAEALRLEQATIDYTAAKAQYELLTAQPRPADLAAAQARVDQAQAALTLVGAGGRAEAIKAAELAVAAAEAGVTAAAAGVSAAESAVADAKTALANCELRAPFDGTVVTVNVRQGEVSPAAGFSVRMADLTAWQVETTDLTELNVIRVTEGASASMTFDGVPGLDLTGKVSQVKLYGDVRQGDIVYTIVVTPDKQDARLRWNMTAKVTIEVK